MAAKSLPRPSKSGNRPPISLESEESDPKFIDDLVATIRLKACLVGRGVEIDDRILDGLAEFQERFSDEIRAYDKSLEAPNGAQPALKSARSLTEQDAEAAT